MSDQFFAYPDGTWLRKDRNDEAIYNEIFLAQDYTATLQMGLGECPYIMDLGAHVGMASRWFLQRFPGCQILAVEPDQGSAECCARNALNYGGRFTLVNGFVSAKDGAAELIRGTHSFGNRKGAASAGGIPCYSMQRLLSVHAGRTVDLLKCDIEGSEVELFEDCAGFIPFVRHAAIEVHRGYYGDGFDLPMLYAALTRQGIKFNVFKELRGCLTFLQFTPMEK